MHVPGGMPVTPSRLHPGDAVRIRGERWLVVRQHLHGDAAILDVRGADTDNAGSAARFLLPFEPLEPLVISRALRPVRPTRWRRLARHALATATPSVDSLRTAAAARIDLLPYQLEPALALTTGQGCRLLIADEVGLGKTVQAGLIIAELLNRIPDGRALVICPAGLRAQWQEELSRRFQLAATVLDATGVARVAGALDDTANPWATTPLVVSSIDFIKRPEVMRALEGLVWDVVVLDEAHNLATRSDRGGAAGALAWRARTLVMLTATPHSGDEGAFNRLCTIGDRQGRFPLLLFRRTRAEAGIPVARRMHWLRVRPSPAEAATHEALHAYARRAWTDADRCGNGGRLAVSVLLRRAASSAGSLARSVERRLMLLGTGATASLSQLALPFAPGEMDDDQPGGELAVPALADAGEERRHLERLLSLARFAAARESKVSRLRRLLAMAGEPALVFTEYRDTLTHLRGSLAGIYAAEEVVELHGGLTRVERLAAERAFTAGRARLLLATDAASEGLNLHHRCRLVINLEVPWTPVRLEQRIGRVDRIGQRRCVHAVQMVAAGTSETVTTRRLLARARRASGALNGPDPTAVEVAGAILGVIDLPDAPVSSAVLAGIRRPDFRDAAEREVARLTSARRLLEPDVTPGPRPVATILRNTQKASAVWAFEIAVDDAAGSPVWTTLTGVTAHLASRQLATGALPTALATGFLDDLVAAVAQRLRADTSLALQAWLTQAVDREQAIVASIRQRHARIAADLLQPGLFDHRSERRAAAQAAVLEEALGRCHTRLDALTHLSTLTVAQPLLRFAALLT